MGIKTKRFETYLSVNCWFYVDITFNFFSSRWFFKNPSLQFLPNASILERILKIAPHVARICSLVIFHSSPEGILMMVDEDGEHTKVNRIKMTSLR